MTPDVMLLDSDIPEYFVNGKRIRTWVPMHVLLFLFALFISSLNMLEYLQLGWGTHKYLVDLKKHFSSDSPSMSSEVKRPWKSKCLIIAAIVFFLCSVPILKFGVGVLMEIQKSRCIEEDSSGGHLARVYVTYCIFEVLNAIVFACSVRVLMVVQLFEIQSVWFRKAPSPLAPSQLPPAPRIQQVVRDAWHAEKKEYERRGKQVKRMMKPFKYWYLTPWIMFLFMTFVNPHTLLTPWTRYEDSKLLSMSQIYYLLFVILKAIQLFIQNACAVQMNVYHREYYRKMVRRFKKGVTNNDENKTREYQEEARDFSFVFNDKFNFYPNILCIDAKINVDTPFYVLSLVIGIFVTASDGLFK